jgi:hypothetical protein
VALYFHSGTIIEGVFEERPTNDLQTTVNLTDATGRQAVIPSIVPP